MGKTRAECSQNAYIYKSCKCFFKPLNTNFSKSFAQIWHKKKKKKKTRCNPFFGRERATMKHLQFHMAFIHCIKEYFWSYRGKIILPLLFFENPECSEAQSVAQQVHFANSSALLQPTTPVCFQRVGQEGCLWASAVWETDQDRGRGVHQWDQESIPLGFPSALFRCTLSSIDIRTFANCGFWINIQGKLYDKILRGRSRPVS